jgi:hypothetical protein
MTAERLAEELGFRVLLPVVEVMNVLGHAPPAIRVTETAPRERILHRTGVDGPRR